MRSSGVLVTGAPEGHDKDVTMKIFGKYSLPLVALLTAVLGVSSAHAQAKPSVIRISFPQVGV